MRPALSLFLPVDRDVRRRVVAFALVLAVHLLLMAGLILLGRVPLQAVLRAAPIAITFLPEPAAERPAAQVPAPRPSRGGPRAPARVTAPPDSKPITDPGPVPLDIDFDLAKVPEAPAAPAAVVADAGGGGTASGPVYGPVLGNARGGVPPGETLYPVEWAREPTRPELATYLPEGGAPEGSWGIIACRTIPGLRVEDCTELEESPRGSGISRALRRAAWQFRVRPPRENGRTLVGTWVSIRIDFTQTGLK